MASHFSSEQRNLVADRMRRLALQEGFSPAQCEELYQEFASGKADDKILSHPQMLEDLHGPLPLRQTAHPTEHMVRAEKGRQSFARSRQGLARQPLDSAALLAEVADAVGATKAIPKVPQPGSFHFIIVTDPYLPCTKPLDDLSIIKLSDLRYETHHRGKALVVRRAGEICIGRSSTICCVEDSEGEMEALRIFHFNAKLGHNALPQGAVFAIKEPYFTFNEHHEQQIRIDHPSDILVLGPLDDRLPVQWRQSSITRDSAEWKDLGNAALKRQSATEALRCYTSGLDSMTRQPADEQNNGDLRRTLHRNRAHVNLLLHHNDAALADALAALSEGNSTGILGELSKKLDSKAYYRAGCAAYNLRDFTAARSYFERQLQLTPEDADGQKRLRRADARLREQEGRLDLGNLQALEYAKGDAADWTRRVEVRDSPGRGRGLFATEDIQSGDVVMYEKAFTAVWEHEESIYVTHKYNVRTDDVRVSNTGLWQAVVQRLAHNGSLVPQVAALHGLWEGIGNKTLTVDGQPVIDTFQIHDIVSRNSFALTPVSKTGLFEDAHGAAANCGLWIRMSYINHSCVPNAERENIGDIMLLRARAPIAKGEEVFISYHGISGEFDRRSIEMKTIWAFDCSCPLCQAEAADPPHVRHKREELECRVAKFRKERQAGSFDRAPPKAVVAQAEKLALHLAATYDPKRFSGLPRPALADIQCWLISAYGARRDKKIEMATAVLRSLCFVVRESPFSVRWTATSSPDSFAALALLFLSAVMLRSGEPVVAKELAEMTRKVCKVTGKLGEAFANMDPSTLEV
ncbi:hypothetical protein LTR85_009136 [Meristemomyces frigidus]|nr:hypothetical protein LTR85_009136 [Meristemomyces frigidus]